MRFLSILAGLMLIIFGLVFLGLDLMATLEAHGILVASTIGDVWENIRPNGTDAVLQTICAPLPESCTGILRRGLHLYVWIIPGVCGVLLIWLAAFRRKT